MVCLYYTYEYIGIKISIYLAFDVENILSEIINTIFLYIINLIDIDLIMSFRLDLLTF